MTSYPERIVDFPVDKCTIRPQEKENHQKEFVMKRTENECVGCKEMGLPCLGMNCPNRDVTRFYCDSCGEEAQLYHYEGKELCIECIEKRLEKVE